MELNDEKLLELAAKAAGVSLTTFNGLYFDTTGADPSQNIFAFPNWNPLESDSHALRLAVKLRLEPYWDDRHDVVFINGWDGEEDTSVDIYAATRRAIVRAAAAIGEKL